MNARHEHEMFTIIAARAYGLFQQHDIKRTMLECIMDISTAHKQYPLRLAELSKANMGNFSHDILGIYEHLDRDTGKLGDFFVPRYAVPSCAGSDPEHPDPAEVVQETERRERERYHISLIKAARRIEELMRSFETEFDEYFDQAKLDEAREELSKALKPFSDGGEW